ncbi:hypothetical protein LTR62_005995 [Meristemomyces frigidus]|uniref:Phospholipid/glycerol acyltransferase domain-containing protein n=1 Tax=Meristemomyces frigidus TaxID=1508187 RepID=A0AAN7YK11_9PEZI|nr:hypothetical protein LTR62_005995 [Meristemomyces frigidus]
MADRTPHPRSADLAILGDSVHVHPSTTTPESGSPERSLLEPYAKFRQDPLSAFQELGLHLAGTEWRSYDKIIGQPIFYPGFSENMTEMVMKQKKLQKRIAELAQKRVEVEIHEGLLGPTGVEGEEQEHRTRRLARRRQIEDELCGVAEKWTDQMICKMDSKYFIRSAYYIATQLLTRAYHQGIHVNSDEVLHLRNVAEKAAAKKQSIIFLPCHRSHVDYVSLQLICYRLGLALPTVVAGDNLNFPVIGPFLQHAGAMWIRRSFGDDRLYATLVQAYMDTLLQNGFNIECFVEGGRSRTGKLLQPKFGILSYFLESIMSGSIEDAVICPVSTQYDKVIEVDSYVRELLGQPKPKEDLMSFLSASNVLSLKLGRVDVRFKDPWSLRAFLEQQVSRLHKETTSLQTMYDEALKRKLLSTLGYKVLKDINDVSVVMPTALVGTVLLTLRGRGVGKSELVRRVDWLRDRVRAQGGRVAHFVGVKTDVVVDKALEVLGPKLVGSVEGLPEATYYAADRFQLSFYRNMTIHLFISQSLVCAAVYTKVKHGGNDQTQQISHAELHDYVLFLSQLFRAEFIYPTETLTETLKTTILGLENDKVLQTTHSNTTNNSAPIISLHPQELASGRENFTFYCFLLWPFIEASWLGTISLFMLTPRWAKSRDVEEKEEEGKEATWQDLTSFQARAQLLGKTLYHQGELSYFEAVNKETLKNAITRAEEEGIILVKRGKGVPARVRLDSEWIPERDEEGRVVMRGRLWELCERIGAGRRRGGNAVRTRVLALVEEVGRGLFGDAVPDPGATGSDNLRRRNMQLTKALL